MKEFEKNVREYYKRQKIRVSELWKTEFSRFIMVENYENDMLNWDIWMESSKGVIFVKSTAYKQKARELYKLLALYDIENDPF